MKLILPKTLVDDSLIYDELFFLAGPIKGADDWQRNCCEILEEQVGEDVVIVNPCRYSEDHPLYRYKMNGDENCFLRQTHWERHYLARAVKRGCVIFWLPCESKTNPRDDGSPYARDTYGELGEWRGQMMHYPNLKLVIGAEVRFPGLSVIQANFDYAFVRYFHIYLTLEETVAAAVKMSRSTTRSSD